MSEPNLFKTKEPTWRELADLRKEAEMEGRASALRGTSRHGDANRTMSENPYHKEAGHHKPVVTISLSDLTPEERFKLMFGVKEEKKPYTTLNAVATGGCQANVARPI